MNRPELSICIATYNRADFIGQTLDSIVSQNCDGVELVIVDGNSTDLTPQIMSDYVKKYPFIRYFRLPQKGGVDHDYAKAVEFATGKYCWLFTDDDFLVPDAIATVKRELTAEHSLIIVNSEVRNRDMNKTVSCKLLNLTKNEVYHSDQFDALFKRLIPYISFIGCVIIRRDLWSSRDFKAYYGTEFVHVGVIFQKQLPSSALIIEKSLVAIRLGNAQWSPRSFGIWMYKWPGLLNSFTSLSRATIREVDHSGFPERLKQLIIHRARNEYSLKEFRKYLLTAKNSPLFLLAGFVLVLLPSASVRFGLLAFFRLTKNYEAIEWWQN